MLRRGLALHLRAHKFKELGEIGQLMAVSAGTEPSRAIVLAAKITVRLIDSAEIHPRALGIDPIILHTLALDIISRSNQRAEIVHIVPCSVWRSVVSVS